MATQGGSGVVSSPVCDCCNAPVRPRSGYLLSTTSIVLSVAQWEARFTLLKAMLDRLEFDERQRLELFGSTLRDTAESTTPWLVCEDCIALFAVDSDKARSYARDGVDPPETGAVEPGACAQYAAIAWEIVFGRWPASVQQPETGEQCDFCGRKIYRVEPYSGIERATVDRHRAAGAAIAPLGPVRPDTRGWLACMGCTTRMVETLKRAERRR